MISLPPLSDLSGLSPDEVVARIAVLARNGELYSFGSFTTAIYDTAWMSMVYKCVDGRAVWTFPQCFRHILENQCSDGTWPAYATTVDGVLNTSASLLSMLRHRSFGDNTIANVDELETRIPNAQHGLQSLLQAWDVEKTDHVGFEVLVPGILRQLAEFGLEFDFPGKRRLQALHDRKIAKFKPAMVYTCAQTTLLHSLEGLIGLIEFDKVSHHCKSDIGLLGSPSSTAAYLMNSSTWDTKAESYLRRVLAASGGYAVPSAFPTGVFEVSWALSIILDKSIAPQTLDQHDVDTLASFFDHLLRQQKGVIGFAPEALADADDTARVIITLRRLGKHCDCHSMINAFESNKHFRTYKLEQNPSPSANCNVLLALLECKSADTHTLQIEKIVEYLLPQWEDGKATDKWNVSLHYVSMLLTEALLKLMEKYDQGQLQRLPKQLVNERIPLLIVHLVTDTLLQQLQDGSWQNSLEVTSYCVITIAHCLALPWGKMLRLSLTQALERGQQFIQHQFGECDLSKPEHLWVEKVTYASMLLRSVYFAAASHIRYTPKTWSETTTRVFTLPEDKTKTVTHLLSKMPLFQERSLIYTDLALLQASHYVTRLQKARQFIFPRDKMPVTNDKYLKYVPVLWTAANQVSSQALAPSPMWEMLLASMLIYHVDEYMESVVACLSNDDVKVLSLHIAKACGIHHSCASQRLQINTISPQIMPSQKEDALQFSSSNSKAVADTLVHFVRFIRDNENIARASDASKRDLSIELHDFLLAHIVQNRDNTKLRCRESINPSKINQSWTDLDRTYTTWAYTTGSNTTSCPMAFRFFTCLIENSASSSTVLDCMSAPTTKYCMDTMARHLAVMCRQYNDLGSVDRDRKEKNLNSLDFPIFNLQTDDTCEDTDLTSKAKDDLKRCCEMERSMMNLALQNLRNIPRMDTQTMKQIQVFVDVTDLFGQFYLVKDVSSRMK